MNAHALKVLQFKEVLDLLKHFASSPLTARELHRLRPIRDPVQIRRWFDEVAEYLRLAEEASPPPRPNVRDIGPPLEQSKTQGTALDPKDFITVLEFLEHSRVLKYYYEKKVETYPYLAAIAEHLLSAPNLEAQIKRTIGLQGEILDDATPELLRVRTGIRKLSSQIRDRVATILKRYAGAEILQEDLPTIRNNRLVIPVKIEEKRKLKGIIHDQSASGATVFIEPEETIPMNNALVSLESRERVEVHRILVTLTDQVRVLESGLTSALTALTRLDVIHCKSVFTREYNGAIPTLVTTGAMKLRRARHPLLVAQRKQAPDRDLPAVIPLDMEIQQDRPIVVISGPNAGGKTVALKTIGLCVLLAQSGIPILAEPTSEIPLFTRVYADIGDEQSIEASLSTFSGHILNIKRILDGANHESLVLLDELGAGTDPDQGGVLGIAILEELLRRGAKTVATTHHDRIKVFTQIEPRIINACMIFDEERLTPTYRLKLNLAGKSYTFLVAQGLGLPKRLIDRANELLDKGELDREKLLVLLEQKRDELDRELDEARIMRTDASKLLDRRKAELQKLRQELERERTDGREQIAELLRTYKATFEGLIKTAKQEGLSQDIRRDFRKDYDAARNLLQETIPVKPTAPVPGQGKLAVGSAVWIASLKLNGKIEGLSADGLTATVTVAGKRLAIAIAELSPYDSSSSDQRGNGIVWSLPDTDDDPALPLRLHLLGYRVHEAQEALDRYLDQAVKHRYPIVTIVHGFGTGKLMKAVTAYLTKHPQVAEFRKGDSHEGGGGVTVVTLKV